jgi:hypothetical protein
MGGANADLGTTLLFAQAPVRESDFPFLPCRLTRARTHAHIHARRRTGEDKRALRSSAFVVATAAFLLKR